MRVHCCPKSAQPKPAQPPRAAASPPVLPQPCPAEVKTWLFPQGRTNNFPSSGLFCLIIHPTACTRHSPWRVPALELQKQLCFHYQSKLRRLLNRVY